jgi:hypothetical protein
MIIIISQEKRKSDINRTVMLPTVQHPTAGGLNGATQKKTEKKTTVYAHPPSFKERLE